MPITIKETADGTGIVYGGDGIVTSQQLLDAVQLIRSFGEKTQRWMFCLHDFSRVEDVKCSADEIRNLASQDNSVLAPMFPKGFVVAVVTSKDHVFGLARMWQAQAEDTQWDIDVFRSRTDAEGWVRERVQANFGAKVLIDRGAIESRRSTRVRLKIHIEVRGATPPISCEGETRVVNCHGALIMTADTLRVGMNVEIHVIATDKRALAKVVYVDPDMPRHCGIGLEKPHNIWGVTSPPDDWKMDDALANAGVG